MDVAEPVHDVLPDRSTAPPLNLEDAALVRALVSILTQELRSTEPTHSELAAQEGQP